MKQVISGEFLRIQHIENAIKTWEDKLNGVRCHWDKKEYSKEYCQKQIEYFKNLLEK